MQILSLELQGYRRLALNSINYIKLTPKSKIQLILGTNGSGKSSLMKELSPLPAIPAEFNKDGFKVIEILHNNSQYVLKSIFSSSGNKFHFIKDDEELNPGGTSTVYKELVRKEFNITQDIHDLMTGATCFHSMSVSDRRNWFTRISAADYTYAIQYYNRLKEQLRDIQGANKLNQTRLVQESEKLLKPEEEIMYRDQIVNLNNILAKLLELKTPSNLSKDQITDNINQIDNKLIELSKQLIKHRSTFTNKEGFISLETLDYGIIAAQSSVMTMTSKSDELCKLIEEHSKTLEVLQKTNVESTGDLDNSLNTLTEAAGEVIGQIKLRIPFTDPKHAYSALLTVYDQITEIVTVIASNGDKSFSRDNYIATVEQLSQLNIRNTNANQQQLVLIAKKKELEHFKEHNELVCPECKFRWFKGYDEAIYQDILFRIEQNSMELDIYASKIAELDTRAHQIKEYLTLYKSFQDITRTWTILDPFWKYLINTGLIFDNPRQILKVMSTLKVDLQLAIKLEDLNARIKNNLELKELVAKNQELDLNNLAAYIDKLNNELYLVNKDIRDNNRYISKLNLYRQSNLGMEAIRQQLETIVSAREKNVGELMESIKRDCLNESIRVIQMDLSKYEQSIAKVNIQQALVANIESQIAEHNDKAEVLKIAIKELSPIEGLIAKGLTGFINHFVFQVNSFIKKVWLYPLELIPIKPDEDNEVDLDYKFAVKVNDNIIIPDISKASSAMKEVIDLAFRIVSMHYLHLDTAPLFLDEFAKTMDAAHRQSAFYTITNLLTSANFSQIYMISHYEQSYGSLKNSDITVLCPGNIILPKDLAFNQAVIIK